MLDRLLDHPFFFAPQPKSLDRNDSLGTTVEALTAEDAAATLTTFTAARIARAFGGKPPSRHSVWRPRGAVY
jgi:anhydro-N-acetylmuramic acid kinase